MNNLKIVSFFLVLLFLSNTCQTNPESQKQRVVTVAVDTDDVQVVPDVDEKSSYTEYGPGQVSQDNTSVNRDRLETVGIIIGPSKDFDTDVMDYVSCLQKSDIKINFVAGLGSSSVIAALFAQTKKPEFVKWKLFRLKERKDPTSIIEELEISTRSIKRSIIAFYLTTLRSGKSIVFNTKGHILRNLEENIKSNDSIIKNETTLSNEDVSELVAQKIFVFSYDGNLKVSKNKINGKMIHINMPKQNYSLMKKCEIIKENL